MPAIQTRDFGVVSTPTDSVVEFPEGLPGFPEEKAFLLIEEPRSKPIIFLQSANTPEICFITLPALAVAPDYRPVLTAEQEEQHTADLLCLVIVTLAEGAYPTANLLAPVVVNVKKRIGVQVVQAGTEYSHQHPLFSHPDAPC